MCGDIVDMKYYFLKTISQFLWLYSSQSLTLIRFPSETWTLGRKVTFLCLSKPNTCTSWPFQFTVSVMPTPPSHTHTQPHKHTHTHMHALPCLSCSHTGKVSVNHSCTESQMSPDFDIPPPPPCIIPRWFFNISSSPSISSDLRSAGPRCMHVCWAKGHMRNPLRARKKSAENVNRKVTFNVKLK